MTEFKIPIGNEIELNQERLANLLANAVKDTLALLRPVNVNDVARTLVVIKETRAKRLYAPLPNYLEGWQSEQMQQASVCEAVNELTTYLWEHKTIKLIISFSNDEIEHDEQEQKTAWSSFIFSSIVLDLAFKTLDLSHLLELLDNRDGYLWTVPQDLLQSMATERAQEIIEKSKGQVHIIAYCLLHEITLPDDVEEFIIDDEISIRRLSDQERSVLFSRYELSAGLDNFRFGGFHNPYIVEVRFDAKTSKDYFGIDPYMQPVFTYVSDTLNLLKWSIMVTTGQVPAEGDCIFASRCGTLLGKLKRDPFNLGFPFFLNSAQLDGIKELIANYTTCRRELADLDRAIWMFGRSCVANTMRDVILEAAIGLDTLLTTQRDGSFAYKFSLHGTALISSLEHELAELGTHDMNYDFFKDLYSKRSSAAHTANQDFEADIAMKARKALAAVILAIVKLKLKGEFEEKGDKQVAQIVQNFVLKQVSTKSQPTT